MNDNPIIITVVESDKPFTDLEEDVMELLLKADNAFKQLPNQHRGAVKDWDNHMHDLQRGLAMRTMRRLFPDYFPITE